MEKEVKDANSDQMKDRSLPKPCMNLKREQMLITFHGKLPLYISTNKENERHEVEKQKVSLATK